MILKSGRRSPKGAMAAAWMLQAFREWPHRLGKRVQMLDVQQVVQGDCAREAGPRRKGAAEQPRLRLLLVH